MKRTLEAKEWSLINDLVLTINEVFDVDVMRAAFLNAMKSLVFCDKATFYLVEEQDGKMHLQDPVLSNVSEEFARAYEDTIYGCDYGNIALSTRKTFAYRDTDFLRRDIRMGSEVYKTFLKPYDVPYAAGIIVANNREVMAEITFFRKERQGDFNDKDIEILSVLAEHLEIWMLNNRHRFEICEDQRIHALVEKGLTEREIEIVKLVLSNNGTKKIGSRLGISVYTVRKHLNNIYQKLGIGTRSELITLYFTRNTENENALKD